MTHRLLKGMLAAIALLSVFPKFVVNLGVNIRPHEFLFPPFIAIGFLHFFIHRPKVPRPLFVFLCFKWGFFSLAVFSASNLILPSASYSLAQFWKGITSLLADTSVLSIAMLLLVTMTAGERHKILRVLLGAVILSSLYGLVQLVAMLLAGFDIDAAIAARLPIFSGIGPGLSRYAVGTFYRFTGLTGDPNVQASFMIALLSYGFVSWLYSRSWRAAFLLGSVSVMMILTMSNSGIIGLIVSLTVASLLFAKRIRLEHLLMAGIIMLLLSPLVFTYFDAIIHFVGNRTNLDGSIASHLQIALQALRMWWQQTSGCGYNNFSVSFGLMYPESTGMNPHNNFISVLCELGMPGLIMLLTTLGYAIAQAFLRRNASGNYFICWCLGATIAACGYQTLELFYNQLFLVVVFCIACSADILFQLPPERQKAPLPDVDPVNWTGGH